MRIMSRHTGFSSSKLPCRRIYQLERVIRFSHFRLEPALIPRILLPRAKLAPYRRIRTWLMRHFRSQRHVGSVAQASSAPLSQRRLGQSVRQGLFDYYHRSMPLAYIIGNQPFLGFSFQTRSPTLIPRWETEEWVSRLVDRFRAHSSRLWSRPSFRILDICCGTGCISLGFVASLSRSFSMEQRRNGQEESRPLLLVSAVDVSESALQLASENESNIRAQLQARSIPALFPPVQYYAWNVFEDPLPFPRHSFDLILCNPPYIPSPSMAHLPKSVRCWEDHRALDGLDASGTAFYRRIFSMLGTLIDPQSCAMKRDCVPVAVFEMDGEAQQPFIEQLFHACHFSDWQIHFHRDSNGKTRTFSIERKQ